MNNASFHEHSAPSEPASRPASSPIYRLLIVEDDAATAHMMLTALSHAGFECRHAVDGATAIEALREQDFHLVLLDLNLRDINGQELCRQIREASDLPVMVVTGVPDDSLELQCLKLGADYFIQKPFVAKVMVARVIAMLRRTYRYNHTDGAAPTVSAAHDHETHHAKQPAVVARDWSRCDYCNYMGPTARFARQDPAGQTVLICPHCHTRGRIEMILG
jgi:DNA-binding response OmpR family regulator